MSVVGSEMAAAVNKISLAAKLVSDIFFPLKDLHGF